MKNGRFSLKKTGKRWLTSTSNASLSTWLKSGLTVASSVTADVRPYFTLTPKSPRARVRFQLDAIRPRLIARERRARNHFEQAPRLKLVERDDGIRLEHPLAGRHLGPRRRHARAAQPPPEQHAHAHVRAAAKADVFERDANLRRPAVGADVAGALPHPVGREVFAARSALQRVHLDAAGIDEEVIGELARAARVEADADPIVAERVVAAADGRPNSFRAACRGSGTRNTAPRASYADPDLRLFRGRLASHRVVRHPRVERERIARPRFVVENAVELRRCRNTDGRRSALLPALRQEASGHGGVNQANCGKNEPLSRT